MINDQKAHEKKRNHKKRIGTKTKSIAKLFKGYPCIDDPKTIRQCIGKINRGEIGKTHAKYHGPDPLSKSTLSDDDSSEYTTQNKRNYANDTIYGSVSSRT